MSLTPSEYINAKPFKAFIQQVLPTIYDDSLSYSELLYKVLYNMNLLVENNNLLISDIQKLYEYTNDYFENLNVQTEIDNKLEQMYQSGQLDELFKKYLDPKIEEQNEKIDYSVNTQNEKIDVLEKRMDTFTSLTEGSTTGDAELEDIRVWYDALTSDTAGNATRGQAKQLLGEINKNKTFITEMTSSVTGDDTLGIGMTDLLGNFENGGINGSTGALVELEGAFRNVNPINYGKTIKIKCLKGSVYVHTYDNGSWTGQKAKLTENMEYEVEQQDIKLVILSGDKNLINLNNLNTFVFITYPVNYNFSELIKESINGSLDNTKSIQATITNTIINLKGKEVAYDTGCVTPFANIVGYDKLTYNARINKSGYYIAFYDQSKIFMPEISIPSTTQAASEKTETLDLTDEKYKNAFYARVNSFNKEIDNAIVLKKDISPEFSSPLKGKTFNALGDSITSDDYTTPTWWELIQNACECTFNDYGISGTTVAYDADRETQFGKCMAERVEEMSLDADGVVFMGGSNDNNTKLGAYDSEDISTFFGALNKIMKTMCSNFAGKPLLVCTPIQKANSYEENVENVYSELEKLSSESKLTLQMRSFVIKIKAEQYGVPLIDLFNSSGINGVDTEKVYYRPSDNIHPSAIGQNRLFVLIKNKLESIV